jgi:hypothetical protein
MRLIDARAFQVQAGLPAANLGAGSGASGPAEWGLSAPELTIGPLIVGDVCVGRDRRDSEGAPFIAAETPQCAPSLSSHTSRWAANTGKRPISAPALARDYDQHPRQAYDVLTSSVDEEIR